MVPWYWRAQAATALALLLQCMVPSLMPAQVRVGLTAGTHAYAGASAPVAGGDTLATLRPHGAYAIGAAASYQRGPWRARLGVERSTPGAAASVHGVEFADRTLLDLWTLEPALARRLLTTDQGAAAWLELGAGIFHWMPYDEANRTVVGGTAAVVWTQRATRHMDLSVRAHLSASPSPFVQDNLTPELKPSTLWRWGVTLEVARRL